MCDRKQPA